MVGRVGAAKSGQPDLCTVCLITVGLVDCLTKEHLSKATRRMKLVSMNFSGIVLSCYERGQNYDSYRVKFGKIKYLVLKADYNCKLMFGKN